MTIIRDYADHRAWRAAFESLRAALVTAQGERDLRREADESGKPAWIDHETAVMLAEVNRLRRLYGKFPVTEEHVNAKESLARGHSDYSVKWALGCADLVIE